MALLREIGVEERKAAVLHAEIRCLESVLGRKLKRFSAKLTHSLPST